MLISPVAAVRASRGRSFFLLTAVLLPLMLMLLAYACTPTLAAVEDIVYDGNYADDGNEPPTNPFLADSPWPMTHRNPYCQASSPYAGPGPDDDLTFDYVPSTPGSSTLAYSNPDSNGDHALHQNSPLYAANIDPRNNDLRFLNIVRYAFPRETLSAAYYFVDKDNIQFTQRYRSLISYRNAIEGNVFSGIVEKDVYELPGSAFRSDSDTLVGFNMMYDGYLVFTTKRGMVGVVQRDFSESSLRTIPLSEDQDEEISNMMAVDENGGIYIVSSKRMYRAQWDGTTLSVAWTADYETGPAEQVAGRLGAGSGSTPSLMGTADGQDKFVVITDGQPLMHLVLFWRDEIPDDWEAIAPGKDRRIAAEVPVTFGDPLAETSVSEQSVLVRGYSAVVVNNDYGYSLPLWIPEIIRQLLVVLSGSPGFAPYGVEKFVWDPTTRTLNTAWTNADISCPNGIPTMSVASNLFYCVGQRTNFIFSTWNIEALDWSTGESVFFKPTGMLPRYNSGYAGLEIGPDRELVTGTFFGVLRLRLGTDDDWWTSWFGR